jgi:hypothetical protein
MDLKALHLKRCSIHVKSYTKPKILDVALHAASFTTALYTST